MIPPISMPAASGRPLCASAPFRGKKWQSLLAAASLGGSLLMVSCSKSADGKVLATVGARQITVADFDREVQRRRDARQPLPDKQALLQEMVRYAALLDRARAVGVDADPKVRREIEHLLIGRLRERELGSRLEGIEVTEAEVAAEYEHRLERYTRPAKVRLALLVLKGQPASTETKRAELKGRLEEARRRILETPAAGGRGAAAIGFGSLATDFSDDQASRHRGGDIGWLEPDEYPQRWPRPVLEAGFNLAQGEISPVLTVGHDYYLIMKTDARPESVLTLPEVRASIRQSLLAQKRRQLEEAFERESLASVPVKVNETVLASVTLPETKPTIARTSVPEPPALMGGNDPTNGN